MGITLGTIMEAREITLSDLSGREIAVDAFNSLYAFIAIIRQPDGSPLVDSQGRVTSHLSGLFYRNIRLLSSGIRPVYIFDGKSPELKTDEVRRRQEQKDAAQKEWKQALDEGRTEDALKAAKATSRITTEIIEESKMLLGAMGIPDIQAPSEGEALAAQITEAGITWAGASQDNDLLLYNCPRMIRNLVGRRTARSRTSKTIPLEVIELEENLRRLGITREQLIDISILVGTDYNEKVAGVGQKTALKLVKKHGSLEKIESETGREFQFPYAEIRDIFMNPPTMDLAEIEWLAPEEDAIRQILCAEHDFSQNRVDKALDRLLESYKMQKDESQQSSLTDFF
ncbi:MAG: flap endonuclease-1 [Candidatus Thorarchaeota archaeon]